MRAFGIAKTSKNAVRYCKIQVLRGSEKSNNIIKNGCQNDTQKHPKWSHWRPWGGQWATLSPTLVDFEGSENRSIFEAPSGRQQIDGCSPLGGSGGQNFSGGFNKSSAPARHWLGGGVRFEKGVPRAALVRARLINKLIRFREFIIFRTFETTNA